jgi:putative transposase
LKERGYLPQASESLRILSATVSEKAGRWFVALQVQEKITVKTTLDSVVGVDLGLHNWMTVSDGTVIRYPRTFNQQERRLRRLQRRIARQQHGSRNFCKTVQRLQRLHMRIRNQRHDMVHKATTWLAKTKSVIVVEDLHLAGIQRHPHLGKTISDLAFGKVRRQLEYKTQWYGSRLITAPRFFPSSKRCSQCGHVHKELSLSTRVFRCLACGVSLDRDLNASYNLLHVAASWAETENACRETGGYSSKLEQCPSVMQEPNTGRSVSFVG